MRHSRTALRHTQIQSGEEIMRNYMSEAINQTPALYYVSESWEMLCLREALKVT
jgi:hypothetical protein